MRLRAAPSPRGACVIGAALALALRVLKRLTVHMVGDKAGSLKAGQTQLIRGQLSVSVMRQVACQLLSVCSSVADSEPALISLTSAPPRLADALAPPGGPARVPGAP